MHSRLADDFDQWSQQWGPCGVGLPRHNVAHLDAEIAQRLPYRGFGLKRAQASRRRAGIEKPSPVLRGERHAESARDERPLPEEITVDGR
jgi:hypothetical protein